MALANTTLPFLYSDGLNFDDNHTGWLWTLPARKVDNSKIISKYLTLLHLKGIAYYKKTEYEGLLRTLGIFFIVHSRPMRNE